MKHPIPRIRLSQIKRPSTPLVVPQLNQRPVDAGVALPEVRGPIPVPVPAKRTAWGAEPAAATAVSATAVPLVVPEPAVVPGEGAVAAGAESVERVDAVAAAEPTAVPEHLAKAGFTLPVPPAPAGGSGGSGESGESGESGGNVVEEPVSTGVMNHSSSPALIRASSMVFKWTLIGGALLAVAFVAVRYLVPIVNELRAAKTAAPVVVDKDASTAVKAIQATRQVVAKGEANVAYLNEVVGAVETKPVVPPAVATPTAKPSVAATASAVGVATVVEPGAYQEAIARLKVDSVSRGPQPKAFIDGRLVKEGEIINRQLGLRFVGVDEAEHALLFTNAENVTFRKYY